MWMDIRFAARTGAPTREGYLDGVTPQDNTLPRRARDRAARHVRHGVQCIRVCSGLPVAEGRARRRLGARCASAERPRFESQRGHHIRSTRRHQHRRDGAAEAEREALVLLRRPHLPSHAVRDAARRAKKGAAADGRRGRESRGCAKKQRRQRKSRAGSSAGGGGDARRAGGAGLARHASHTGRRILGCAATAAEVPAEAR
jgi:hypothetical protein